MVIDVFIFIFVAVVKYWLNAECSLSFYQWFHGWLLYTYFFMGDLKLWCFDTVL